MVLYKCSRVMSKLCVGIICGGRSLEHEVSLRSAVRIVQCIDRRRFDVSIIWINRQGCWYMQQDIKSDRFLSYFKDKCISVVLKECPQSFFYCNKNIRNVQLKCDVIFPIVHGTSGEDGTLQGFLRVMDIPFVGSDVLGSSISMNKDVSKCLLRDAGILVVPSKTFVLYDRHHINFDSLVSMFGLPFFLKPVNQGSSIGVSKITNYKNFLSAIDIAFSVSHKILVERMIVGKEIECAVLGNDNPEVSVCGEIVLKGENFYTYYDKYVDSENTEMTVPANISDVMSEKIRYIAYRAFQVLHCVGMARVDFFWNVFDDNIFLNEVNTLPGFTDTSMYVRLWEATGLSLQKLITRLIELALDVYDKRNVINYKNYIQKY